MRWSDKEINRWRPGGGNGRGKPELGKSKEDEKQKELQEESWEQVQGRLSSGKSCSRPHVCQNYNWND